ncbi:bifunctional cytidylyltransferase/SDR family oxidoreductase [Citrobacter portucalensis]|uniref:bifunctional cytidylyltransferase/SDR family oxidoreductase n=1 Tax=Citrobacter portucalensis TaxID=1639133 RepID=UPI00334EE9EC
MRNVAVILSGGSGARFGSAVPKQFTKLAGKIVIEYTVECFEKAHEIDEIVIVSQSEYVDFIWELVQKNGWNKIKKVVCGGDERFFSSLSAIKSLSGYEDSTNVLLHDAVRPLVDYGIITRCISALESFDAVDVVISSADTLVEVYDNGCIKDIPDRIFMRRGQTPQAFKLRVIEQAYYKAVISGKSNFTCDCSVVRSMLPAVTVATVAGSEENIKVTRPIDLFIAEKYLQEKHCSSSVTSGNLSFLKNKVVVIFGGNSGIGNEIMKEALIWGAHVHIASRSHNNIDITDIALIEKYLKSVFDIYGRVDYIINTAGVLIKKPFNTLSKNEVSSLININYAGAVNVALAAKKILNKRNGMLLNFTSSSYTRGRAFYALYSSAKAAIVNLTQALAEEWSADDIKINCINPERTSTPMRVKNFGIEPGNSLLEPKFVAIKSLEVLAMNRTGIVIDIRKDNISV